MHMAMKDNDMLRSPGCAGRTHPLMIGPVIFAIVLSCLAGCTSSGSGNTSINVQLTPMPTARYDITSAGITEAPSPIPSGLSVMVNLTAKNMSFSLASITVPAKSPVVVNFHNSEPPGSSQVTGIAHNFAIYDSPAATTMIFRGDVITGGEDAVYRFTAPTTPGTYFFRCDVHPMIMNGSFIVQ